MKDLSKIFSQKSSMWFHRRRYKGVPAQVMISGGNSEYSFALKPEDVVRLMICGRDEMKYVARDLGYTGVDDVDFVVDYQMIYDDRGDDYDPYNVGRDFFFLIAQEKT
jgi:hypothetical protein